MKLEIDIPSILYQEAKENRNYISLTKLEIAWKIIADGKPLEQEPFINKPCVSSGVCEHDRQQVLDKIRAEIKHFMYDINPSSSESDYACNYILQIIDKYKAETEDK